MANRKDKDGVLFTPIGILASKPRSLKQVYVDKKNGKSEDDGKYFARIMLTEEDLKTPAWTAIAKALLEAGREKFGKGFAEGVKDNSYRWPLRRDLSKFGYKKEEFAAFINLNAYADNPPRLIGRDGLAITDFALFKTGCRVRSSVYVSAYDFNGNQGVNIKMRGVQYCGGVVPGLTLPTKGHGDADDDFGAVGGPDDEEADAKRAETSDADDDELNGLLG